MKICFITAIYGGYEVSCKPFYPQTIPCDFICFTDAPNILANGWDIDTTPYHITHPSRLDDGTGINSLKNNTHTFNIAKYYKQAFYNIPRLSEYDIIVWLDGTIQITNNRTAEDMFRLVSKHKIVTWKHSWCNTLYEEVLDSSKSIRYNSTFWANQYQPIQDVLGQYRDYDMPENSPAFLTCLVGWSRGMHNFLDDWYRETLIHTTQDQISFSYVCYLRKFSPFILEGQGWWDNQYYKKLEHGM